jgi:hypothetical protein
MMTPRFRGPSRAVEAPCGAVDCRMVDRELLDEGELRRLAEKLARQLGFTHVRTVPGENTTYILIHEKEL